MKPFKSVKGAGDISRGRKTADSVIQNCFRSVLDMFNVLGPVLSHSVSMLKTIL